MPSYKVKLDALGAHNVYLSGSTSFNHLILLMDINMYSGCSLYHPYFTSTGSSYALLSCGPLTSSTATIGNYLIDWHWNSIAGEIILKSGNSGNTDTNINAVHPFTNIPVPGGLLYPVIQYIYINGIKYVSNNEDVPPDDTIRYSPDLASCINPINIPDMTCSNGNNPISNYSHGSLYNFTASNTGQSSKILTFILNTGGTTKYFAWDFRGFAISDTIKITYTGATTQILDYWRIGQDAGTNLSGSPKAWSAGGMNTPSNFNLQTVSNLSGITYTLGDYLKIEVTPSQTNLNTNWALYMKCITGTTSDTYTFCDTFPNGFNVINLSSITMIFYTGSSQCYYQLRYNTVSAYTYTNSNIYKYFSTNFYNFGTGGSGFGSYNDQIAGLYFFNYTQWTFYGQGNMGAVIAVTGSTSIVKNGNQLTVTCEDSSDYNAYRDSYLAITGATNFSNYTSDNTQSEYYKYLYIWLASGTTIGDDNFLTNYTFHYSSPVVFNDTGKTFTIFMTGATNGLASGVSCDNRYSLVGQYPTNISTNFNWPSTKIRYTAPMFYGVRMSSTPNNILNQSASTYTHLVYIPPALINNVCGMSTWGLITGNTGDFMSDYLTSVYGPVYVSYKTIIKGEITNMSDPLNNYCLYSGLDTGTNKPMAWQQIYCVPTPETFVFTVNIPSSGTTVTLPLVNNTGYTYNASVVWGDGSINSTRISAYNSSGRTHIYSNPGTYDIQINGTCQGFSVDYSATIRTYITQVKRWGTPDFKQIDFYGCSGLTSLPAGPLTGMNSGITSMANFLRECTAYKMPIDSTMFINTPLVTDFSSTFRLTKISGSTPATLFSYTTGVTTFSHTFDSTKLNGSIPSTLFSYCPKVTDFSYTFQSSPITGSIPPELFTYASGVTNFAYTFAYTSLTGSIPPYLFANNSGVTDFSNTFRTTSLTGDIPVQLFASNPNVLTFNGTFMNCPSLGTGSGGTGHYTDLLFQYNTKVTDFSYTYYGTLGLTTGLTNNHFKYCPDVTTFSCTFLECQTLNQSIPPELFRYNTKVLYFAQTFSKTYQMFGTIPDDLFRYNVAAVNFSYCFSFSGFAGSNFTGPIPRDLFAYCTGATDFSWCFRWNLSIEKAPNGLFRNNLLANGTAFYRTFETCANMELEQYVFSASGTTIPGDTEALAAYRRFSGKTMNFYGTFSLNSYTKSANTRYAPELWDPAIYGGMTVTDSTDTFYRNTSFLTEPYINQASIPNSWKGL